jgi:hypothetical protein
MKRVWQVVLAGGMVLGGLLATEAMAGAPAHGGRPIIRHQVFDHRHQNNQNFFSSGVGGFGGLGFFDSYDLNAGYVPFYSLHPPVYYSYPVARTYGWSPFAYGSDVQTPAIENGGPAELINPYAAPKDKTPPPPAPKAKPSAEHTADDDAPQPKVVINPYVEQSVASATAP